MSIAANKLYQFGPFLLDGSEKLLFRNGERIPLTPKAFETLLILVERQGKAVEKDELMNLIWPDVVVEENNLSQNVRAIRKALGESADGIHYIETIPRRGYRFLAEVVTPAVANPQLPVAAPAPTTNEEISAAGIGSAIQTPPVPATPVPTKSKWWLGAIGGALLVLLFVTTLFFWRRGAESVAQPVPDLKLTRLTTTSNSWDVALSPDGKTFAYVQGDAGLQSLKLKTVGGAETDLLPPAENRFRGLAFAPDGNSLYFSRKEKGTATYVLHQRNLHSSEQKILLSGVDSAVTFSPDGKQIAFVRENQASGKSSLVIAQQDGSAERVLVTHQTPDFFSVDGASWSPDGKTIALAVGQSKPSFHFRIATVQVSTGQESFPNDKSWAWAMDVAWLANGKELILLGRPPNEGTNNNQVWRIDITSGKAQKITNDLNDYRGLSLSTTAKRLVTVQAETRANLWVVESGNNAQPFTVTADAASQNGYDGLDWTPDGQIVYTSLRNSQQDLWRIDPKTQSNTRLTADINDRAQNPSVSYDGHFVVFNSGRAGSPRIWRIDIDGQNPQALSNSNLDLQPFCAWQDNWAVYSSDQAGRRTIYKISLASANTAPPQRLLENFAEAPTISPDGKFIACHYQPDSQAPPQVAILSAQGGAPLQILPIPLFARANVRWHSLEKALTYLSRSDDQTNLWLQPLTGGAPRKITNFTGERIFAYAWSRDGKRLAVSRGTVNRDVVMINGIQ